MAKINKKLTENIKSFKAEIENSKEIDPYLIISCYEDLLLGENYHIDCTKNKRAVIALNNILEKYVNKY